MVNESLDSSHQVVKDFFESSIQRQIIIKQLFALNEAQTAKRSLGAIKELTSFLNGANNCGGGDNNLISRVISKEVEMELKTLDSLGKEIQQHKSAELTLKGLDILTGTEAFLAKQHEDLMKVVQEAHKSILADTTPNTRTCAECVICLGELGGALNPPIPPETSGPLERKRGCFLPCMHASACILCCEKVWEEGPQVCPVCKAKLTERPKPLFF